MKFPSFRKPPTAKFGLSKSLYLAVLNSKATLPSLLHIVEPHGANGAIPGYGVPLASGSTKESLTMPLVRGTYAIASVDRKTVLKVMVLDRSESGFDPEEYAESVDGLTADPELIARLRGMWTMTQLRVESYDPLVLPAMFFLLRVTQRLASLSDGVIADPLSERYLLPKQALHRPVGPDLPFFPTDVVKLSFEVSEDGYVGGTLGLKKFDLPEVQIPGLKESSQDLSRHFLGNLTQYILRGNLLSPGDTAGDENLPFRVVKDTSASRDGTTDVIYKLVPPPNTTPEDVIDAWDRAADLEEAEP